MWFTENPWPPMLIAGIASLVFFSIWNNDRRNLYFVIALACLGSIGGIYAVERAIVTEGERLRENVTELCDRFRKRDQSTLDYFSDSVPEWKDVCKVAMNEVEIGDDLRLTDFRTTFTNNRSKANVHFRANATISAMGFKGHHPFRCILSFEKEGGLWKIVDVERLDPIKGDKIDAMAHR